MSKGKLTILMLLVGLVLGSLLYLFPRGPSYISGKDGIDGPWGWFPDNYIELKPGDEKQVLFMLEVSTDVPAKENYFFAYMISDPRHVKTLPFPQGLEVSPPSFEEQPHAYENYVLTVTVKASLDLTLSKYYVYIDGHYSIAGDAAAIMPHGRKTPILTVNIE